MKKIIIHFGNSKTTNIITLIVGTALLIFPSFFVKTICYILGILAICYSIQRFLTLYKFKAYSFTIVIPIITFFLGLTLINNPSSIVGLLPLTIGIYMIATSISKLTNIFGLYGKIGKDTFKYYIPSGISLILGFILLTFPFGSAILVLRVIGGTLIYTTIQNFFYDRFNQNHKKQDGPIEASFDDHSDEM